MKKYIFAFTLLVLLAGQLQPSSFYAPELFAYGEGVRLEAAGYEAAVIHAYWGEYNLHFLFLMIGKQNGNKYIGRVYQIYGEPIMSYPPYDCSTSRAYCYERSDKTNWRGWIEFRGSRRPFCGGNKIKEPCIKSEF